MIRDDESGEAMIGSQARIFRYSLRAFLLAISIVLAAPVHLSAQTVIEADFAALRTLIAEGEQEQAITAANKLVLRTRAGGVAGADLARALRLRAEALELEDTHRAKDKGDKNWNLAGADRSAALAILASLPVSPQQKAQASAEMIIHHVRRSSGPDALPAWRGFMSNAGSYPNAREFARDITRAACTQGEFVRVPSFARETGIMAMEFSSAFAPGDEAAIKCVIDRIDELLGAEREIVLASALARLAVQMASAPQAISQMGSLAVFTSARVHAQAGRLDDSLLDLDKALTIARENRDDIFIVKVLNERSGIRAAKGQIEAAVADAQNALLTMRNAKIADLPLEINAHVKLGTAMAADRGRFAAAGEVLSRAVELARELLQTNSDRLKKDGDDALLDEARQFVIDKLGPDVTRAVTGQVNYLLAQGNAESAMQLAQDMIRASVPALDEHERWDTFVQFPANTLISLVHKQWHEAHMSSDMGVNRRTFWKENKNDREPIELATGYELEAYLHTFAIGRLEYPRLNAAAIDRKLALALELRRGALAANHPSIANHFALRAIILAKRGKNLEAAAQAREGARLLAERRRQGDQSAAFGEGLLFESAFRQLVARNWEAGRARRK